MIVVPRRKVSGGSSSVMRTRRLRVTGSACGAISRILPSALNLRIKLKRDNERHADPQRAGEIVGDVDDGFANIGARDRHHGLARRDDLADLGANGGDDAVKISLQLGIAELFARFCQIRLRAAPPRTALPREPARRSRTSPWASHWFQAVFAAAPRVPDAFANWAWHSTVLRRRSEPPVPARQDRPRPTTVPSRPLSPTLTGRAISRPSARKLKSVLNLRLHRSDDDKSCVLGRGDDHRHHGPDRLGAGASSLHPVIARHIAIAKPKCCERSLVTLTSPRTVTT